MAQEVEDSDRKVAPLISPEVALIILQLGAQSWSGLR